MRIKTFIFSMMLSLITLTVFAQRDGATYSSNQEKALLQPKSIFDIAEEDSTGVSFEELVNQVIQALTNSDAEIQVPGKFDPRDSQNVFDWWIWVYGLLFPVGMWVISRFWPSASKPELILKSTSIGIIVLLMIVFLKGASFLVIGQAVLAFIFKTVTYKELYQPLGLSSAKKY